MFLRIEDSLCFKCKIVTPILLVYLIGVVFLRCLQFVYVLADCCLHLNREEILLEAYDVSHSCLGAIQLPKLDVKQVL